MPVSTRSHNMAGIDIETMTKLLRAELTTSMKGVTEEIKILNNKFDNLQATLTQVSNTANQAHEIATEASSAVSAVDKRVSDLEAALSSSRIEQKQLHDKTLYLESYSRRVNLKLEGINEKKDEDCFQVARDLIAKMNIDCNTLKISKVHRIGPYNSKQSSPRAIIIQFMDICDREKVWEKRGALKGTGLWIKEDFPAEIEARRKTLWPYVRAARLGDPQYPQQRITAFLKVDKLVINHQVYESGNISSLPEFVKARVEKPPTTIKTEKVSIFFTQESPFSNFYPCTFDVDDTTYSSVEQYLCFKKALLFDTKQVAEEILSMNEPKFMKRRAKRLANFNAKTWEAEAGDILMTALDAKFSQDRELRDELLSTGNSTIGEACSHDLLFGIGLSLHNPNAVDKSRWRGFNLQGKKLMEVRDKLANIV